MMDGRLFKHSTHKTAQQQISFLHFDSYESVGVLAQALQPIVRYRHIKSTKGGGWVFESYSYDGLGDYI